MSCVTALAAALFWQRSFFSDKQVLAAQIDAASGRQQRTESPAKPAKIHGRAAQVHFLLERSACGAPESVQGI
jgi:hypothetical protein